MTPAVLDYAQPDVKQPCAPLPEQGYGIGILLGLIVTACALAPWIPDFEVSSFAALWLDSEGPIRRIAFSGISLVLGGALIWLSVRSHRRSRAAAYLLSSIFAGFAMVVAILMCALLAGLGQYREDRPITAFTSVMLLLALVGFMSAAWSQFAWARRLRKPQFAEQQKMKRVSEQPDGCPTATRNAAPGDAVLPAMIEYHNPAGLEPRLSHGEQPSLMPERVRAVTGLTVILCLIAFAFAFVYLVYFAWRRELTWSDVLVSGAIVVAASAGVVLGIRASTCRCLVSSTVLAVTYAAMSVGASATFLVTAVRHGVGGGRQRIENPLTWLWIPVFLFAAAWVLFRWMAQLRNGCSNAGETRR